MAIDWDSGAGLLDKLGGIVAAATACDTAGGSTGWIGRLDDAIALLTESTDQSFLPSVLANRDADRQALASQLQTVLTDVVNLLNQEIVPAEGLAAALTIDEALLAMRYYMGRDAIAFLENTVALSASTATAANQIGGGTNTGNGTVALTVAGTRANVTTNGTPAVVASNPNLYTTHDAAQKNQGVIPDSYELRCVADAGTVSAGSERLQLQGSALPISKYDHDWQHADDLGNLTILSSTSGQSKVGTDGGFEVISSNTPNGWTLVTGTAGVNFLEYTAAVGRGSKAMRMVADASTSPQMTHSVTLNPGKKYLIGILYKRLVAGVGTCTFTLELAKASGATGSWTPSSSEKTTVNVTGTDGSYVRMYAWVNTPDILPSATVIQLTLLKGSGGTYPDIAIDEVICCEITPTDDGLYVAPMAGTTDPVLNDRWTFSVTNDHAGKFQTFFGRFFDFVMPSTGSGTSTGNGKVDETLAA